MNKCSSNFGDTIEDAVRKMCILLPSCIQGLISKAQGAREPAFCPSLHPHLITPPFTMLGLSGPLSFTVVSHGYIDKMENIGWEMALLIEYYYTNVRTQLQIPRNCVKIWVLQCTPVIPVLGGKHKTIHWSDWWDKSSWISVSFRFRDRCSLQS